MLLKFLSENKPADNNLLVYALIPGVYGIINIIHPIFTGFTWYLQAGSL